LRRRQERGWLKFGDPTIDPDLVDGWLSQITVWLGSSIDAYWVHIMEYDCAAFVKARRRIKLFLARYGRQSVLQWGDTDVTEITEYFYALVEMMSGEGVSEEASEVMSGD